MQKKMNLFLKPPSQEEQQQSDGNTAIIIRLIDDLASLLWRVITSDGRSEARQWLFDSVSTVSSVFSSQHTKLFLSILQRKDPHINHGDQEFERRILRMVCENSPNKAGKLLARRSHILTSFFKGNKKRILQWFDHFAGVGESEHKRGAWSISQFAFRNRDICWDELEWKGKHGQSPAMVATKPHYFLDLDVVSSVENFLENVPEYWSSQEFAESLEDGQIVSVDLEYFVEEFLHMMYRDGKSIVWDMLEDYLAEEKFSVLCQRLLILLGDSDLISFLKDLKVLLASRRCNAGQNLKQETEAITSRNSWAETILLEELDDQSFDDLLLVNACITQSRRVLRLVQEEEHEEEKQSLELLVSDIEKVSKDKDHWGLIGESRKLTKPNTLKLLSIKSWISYYQLSKMCKSMDYCESLFTENGIQFRNCEKALLHIDDLPSKRERKSRKKRKKDRSHKKRKRARSEDEYLNCSSDEDIATEYNHSISNSASEGKWLLSTDNFALTWNMADLPEHLALYSLRKWLNYAT